MKLFSFRLAPFLAMAGISLTSWQGCVADVSELDQAQESQAVSEQDAELGTASQDLTFVPGKFKILPLLKFPLPTYKLYSYDEMRALLYPIWEHGRITTQGNQLENVLTGGNIWVIAGKSNNFPLFKQVYLTKVMVDFLARLDASGARMHALLVYWRGTDPDNGHVRKGAWADPPDPNIYINHAADIMQFSGYTISPFDPASTLNAVVSAIDALPRGTYDLGLPREAYPNYRANKNGSFTADINTYFKPEAANSPGRAYTVLEIDDDAWFLDESKYAPLRKFMPWYTNEYLDPNDADLQNDIAWMAPADQTALRNALARGDSPNIVRYMMRDRQTGIAVADAMQRAVARGVTFGGIYGDALDHFHVQVREIQ